MPAERAWAQAARQSAVVVDNVLAGLKLDQRRAETEILKYWNRVLDPHVASHAQPTGLRRGTLFIAVDSNVWLSELVRYRQGEILERLQAGFGSQVIRRLSFRLG